MSMILDGTSGLTTPGVVNTAGETIATTLAVTGATNLSALTTTGNTILGDASTDTLNVGNGGLVKDASGNVGIGTTSPTGFSGYKTVQTDATSGGLFDIKVGGTRTANFQADASSAIIETKTAIPIVFNTSATERMRIDSSGNLSLASGTFSAIGVYNNTTASAANIHVSSAGGLFFRSTSALKYKQYIRDLESIDIGLLRPVRYKSKCDGDDKTKDHFGLIADEAAEAGFEELVTRGADGEVEGFQYERLTVVLLKAIQELKAIVDAQAVRIAALES